MGVQPSRVRDNPNVALTLEERRAKQREYYQRNKDRIKQRATAWNAANPERRREIRRRSSERNPVPEDKKRRRAKAQWEKRKGDPEHRARAKEYSKRWYAENRDEQRAKMRAYSAAHRAEKVAAAKAWQKANRDRVNAARRRRRALDREHTRIAAVASAMQQRGVPVGKGGKEYIGVLRKDPCSYCGGDSAGESDHIVPIKLGGGSDWMNLTAACRVCNSSKSSRPLLVFMAERAA